MERYDRQLRIFGFGIEKQSRLKRACVAVFGVGGLGSISSAYLAMAGVGRLMIIDKDVVSITDLNRQILYTMHDIGKLKVEVAAKKLSELNPEVEVEGIALDVTVDDASHVISKADVVIDGLDSFKARFIVSSEAYRRGKPFVHGAVYEFEGRLTTIIPRDTPCLKCTLGNPCDHEVVVPVIGPAAGVIGSLQAIEAIKLITGYGDPLKGKILIFSGDNMKFYFVDVDLNRRCEVCAR